VSKPAYFNEVQTYIDNLEGDGFCDDVYNSKSPDTFANTTNA
jgi:hypothetical protein